MVSEHVPLEERLKLANEVVFEVMRENGPENYLNRFCRDPITHEIVYYCETDEQSNVIIHRGDKNGPVIATATQCLRQDGATDIHLTESDLLTRLEHVHSALPFFHGKTFLTVDGKKYHWKGHTALIDDETGVMLAAFHATFFKSEYHKLGRLIITKEGKELMDIVVCSCLVQQERSDEGTLAREMARLRAKMK